MIFRRRKKEEEKDEEQEPKKKSKTKEEVELVWDKKRILIALGIILILFLGIYELKNWFYPDTNILGESTTITRDSLEEPIVDGPNLDLQSQVGTTLEEVRDSVSDIDPEEVASSSPQIQKVLRDIQSIKNLPTDKARNACFNICSSL